MSHVFNNIVAVTLLMSIQSAWAICDAEFDYISNANGWKDTARMEHYKQHQRKEQLGFLNVNTGYSGDKGKIRAYLIESIASHKKSLAKDITSKYDAGKIAAYSYDLCMLESTPIGSTQRASENANPSTNEQLGSTTVAPSQRANTESLLSQLSRQSAQQNQARADKERQGKRKTHNEAAQAHSCIEIDKEPGLFGGFKNTCDYKVNYDFCNFKPKKDSWAAFHDCEKKHGIGADAVGPGRSSAAHNRNTEMVYWFACKDPSWPVDSVFVVGKGIEARCH